MIHTSGGYPRTRVILIGTGGRRYCPDYYYMRGVMCHYRQQSSLAGWAIGVIVGSIVLCILIGCGIGIFVRARRNK